MRRDPAVKRILSLSLAVLLSITTPLVTFAEELPEPVQAEAVQDNSSEGATNTGSESQPASGEGEQQIPADNQTGDSSQSVEPESPSSSTDSSVDGNDSQDENKQNKEDASSDGKPSDSKDDEKLESDSDQKLDDKDSKEGLDDEKEEEEEDEEEEEEEEEEEDEDEEITLEFSDNEVKVTVTGTRKVLKGVKSVKANKITEENNENLFKEIESSLTDEAEDDGKELITFLAYDITLRDEDGNSIEPNGTVKVSIDKVKAPEKQEECEDAKVSLTHFKGSTPDDMTDKSSTTLDTGSNAATVEVEFETDSFSPYVVSWTKVPDKDKSNKIGQVVYYEGKTGQVANVYLVDQNGNPIEGARSYAEGAKEGKFNFSIDASKPYGIGQLIKNNNEIDNYSSDYFRWLDENAISLDGYIYRATYVTADDNVYDRRQIADLRFFNRDRYSSEWQCRTVENNGLSDWNWCKSSNGYQLATDSRDNRSTIDVYMVYEKPQDNNDYYFPGNLFNYDKDDFNAGAGYNNIIFHHGGDIPTNNSTFNNAWNACDTVNSDEGAPTACQGIVQNRLDGNGRPVFNHAPMHQLFNPSDSIYRSGNGNEAYANIQIPFYKEDGYYTLEARGKNRYDYLNNEKKIVRTQDSNSSGFWPFGDGLDSGDDYKCHFGMSMEVDFNVNSDGKADDGNDTVFKFAGDDDVWVFIDGKLVLDMGGVHQSVNGSINFRTGECVVTNANTAGRNPERHNLYSNDYLGGSLESFAGKTHKLSFFYVERGGAKSNCKLQFNFNTTNEVRPNDVVFKKTDEAGKILPGAEFGLFNYKEGGIGENDKPYKTATSGDDGIVRFSSVEEGKYILKETKAPTVRRDDGTVVEYALDLKEYIVEVKDTKVETTAGKETITQQGGVKIYDPEDADKEISEIKNYPRGDYKKKITIIKNWKDDNNKAGTRPGAVEFKVYGKYKDEDGVDKYVAPDDTSAGTSPVPYKTVVISASEGWTKTIEDIPVFFDEDIDKLITWEVFESDIKGYTLIDKTHEYDAESAIVFESPVEQSLPPAANSAGKNVYEHIDIEYYGASDKNATNRRVTSIRDASDQYDNSITAIGYYDRFNGYSNGSNYNNIAWNMHTKTISSNKSDGEGEWRAIGLAVGWNTAVAFRVKFNDSEKYQLVVLTNEDVYPSGTYLARDKYKNVAGDAAMYYNWAYGDLAKHYYNSDANNLPEYIDLSGKNIFEVAEIVCPATTVNDRGQVVSRNYGNIGLDFVLSPRTIEEHIVKAETGNETFTFLNEKEPTVTLTFEKQVTFPGGGNTKPEAVYGFKVERLNEDGSVAEVIGKDTTGASISTTGINPSTGEPITEVNYQDGIFGIRAGQSVTIDGLPAGKYRVTEVNAFYNGKQIPFNTFTTKVYEVEANGEAKVVKTYDNTNVTEARAYEVDFSESDIEYLKFENCFNQEFRFKLVKKNKSTLNNLANAEFELKNKETGVTIYYGISNAKGEVEWFNSHWEVENPGDPKSKILEVETGEYLLKETKAPNGFALSKEEWIVTVDTASGIRVTTKDGQVIQPASSESADGNVVTYAYNFLNEVVYSLPETGGRGVFIYIIGGVLLMIGAALLLYKNKKQ